MSAKRCIQALLISLLFSLFIPVRAHAARSELDLGGAWQFQKVSQLIYPPTNQWQTTTVPGFLTGWQYEHAWFRRTFTVPSAMAGTQLRLRFGGVKYNSQIWLNGVFLGSYLNGYEPFEIDATSAAMPGQTNELIVGVTDWTATFASAVDFSAMPSGQEPRRFVHDKILAPIGGRYDQYGIWQPVTLRSLPPVSISDVFVMPSVRSNRVTARITVDNDTGTAQSVTLTNRVLDGAAVALELPPLQVVVPAGTNLQVDISAAWTNAHLWSHLDPHLYQLQTTLAAATSGDQLTNRFGFRELWCQGPDFYLNGTKIHLLATATWPPETLQDTNQIRTVLQQVKDGNNVAIRFHTQPWDEPWYAIADELGLLVVEEAAVWCDPAAYQLENTVFWTNYSRHLAAAVRRDRNHPSIVLWSLENEILHCGGASLYSGTEAELAELGRQVKAIDPTRPITYEADLDPGGVADAVGLHYPHEFPDFPVWPNAAWWMNQPIPRNWVPGGQWTWDRAKPLYIGEFLWVPGTADGVFTILFGDEAYSDPTYYRTLAKAQTWRTQIEAFRAYGVSAMGPWTEFEDPSVTPGLFDLHPDSNLLYQSQKAAYAPNAAFVDENNAHFFIGDNISRTVRVYNDRFQPEQLTLRWSAGGGWQSALFTVPAAGREENTIAFTAPPYPGPFSLQLEVSDPGAVRFTNSLDYRALPRTTLVLPAGVKPALYDPQGSTAALFSRFGIPYTNITDLQTADYSRFNLLVVGKNALAPDAIPKVGVDTVAGKWQAFAGQGGWVLVLDQASYPAWMPGGLQLQNQDASFAFPNPDHPVCQGLDSADLRWWAPDHRIVSNSIAAPSQGNFRVVSWIGSVQGLESAAAVEVPLGRGGVLCSQWLLADRFDIEPMAGVLLQRLLNYCAPGAAHLALATGTAIAADTNSAAAARLLQLGLVAENVSGRLSALDPAVNPVLVLAGGSSTWQEAAAQIGSISNYLAGGGKILAHHPDSNFLAAIQSNLFPGLEASDGVVAQVWKREATNAVVKILNHDLHWIATPANGDTAEVLSTNLAARYYRNHFNLSSYSTIQVKAMPIHTSGGVSGAGWLLWSDGYAAQNIMVPHAGTYLFNVSASGTPALGGWPQLSLKIDGRAMDTVTVPSPQLAWYSLSADLTAGTHELELSYDNDAYAPPEDRNLYLEQVQWGQDTGSGPAILLSRPGCLAQLKSGAGVLLLDEIAWDVETQNSVKASRYISSLLTGLGASFRSRLAVTVQAETMTNVNISAWNISGGLFQAYSDGRIQTAVNFSTAGNYVFDVVAGGTGALGVLPQIGITIDGVLKTNWFLTTTGMAHYLVSISVPAGTHAVGLAFLNDAYAPPEDRNAYFDQVQISPADELRITGISVNPAQQAATLQWLAVAGNRYEVQISSNLWASAWQTAGTITNNASLASWQDTGSVANPPPLGPGANLRFYRVKQLGP
ncbi:MAG: carbohydrate-binding domain-containing protein [Verrucomicrobiota bacterium]